MPLTSISGVTFFLLTSLRFFEETNCRSGIHALNLDWLLAGPSVKLIRLHCFSSGAIALLE